MRSYLASCVVFIVLIFCCAFTKKEDEKLIFALDIVRHGDRTPLHGLPAAPAYWPEGLGQLTPEGMRACYEFGVSLRKKYIEEKHLISAKYHQDEIYVRSTDYDRTIQSAQSILLGLFPMGTGPMLKGESSLPNGFQPIPIHTALQEQDPLLLKVDDSQQYEALIKQHVYQSKQWLALNAQLEDKYPTWSKATGIDIKKLNTLSGLGDTLYIYRLHKMPLPQGLSQDDISQIIKVSQWIMVEKYKHKVIGEAGSGKLKVIINNYLRQAASKTSLKYVLILAHDSTLLSTLSAMGTPTHEYPQYNSDLNFSLYENKNHDYYVKVTYNGKALIIPNCKKHACALDQFLQRTA
ncbi:MAG: histidine-type phosphatase [Proteobacteria bacterium]|nr:histidine-type phosphatase [Pseudomonadota bacterium]